MKKNNYIYPAVFTFEEGQEIAVIFPDFDVATSGVDEEDAFKSAKELLGLTLYSMEEDKEEIPQPSPINKLQLKKNQVSCLVDVFMPSIREAQNNKSVNRTVTLPAWLNAKSLELGVNFSQVLQEALLEKVGG
nr:type II toxin-antitoxin system HicB family antitoxin [uncultured Oribacterium sp.]